MDFIKIQQQLNHEFVLNGKRKIVFWYDENSEFLDDIDKLVLDNAKVFMLSGKNYFKSKYTIEVADSKSNYLIYAPFSKPIDEENPLLDMFLYSKQFFADYYSILADDLGIALEYRNTLIEYKDFFKNKTRIKAFKDLNYDYKNVYAIQLGIHAVLTKTKVCEPVEIIKSVWMNKNLIDEIEKLGSIDFFWLLCERYFGYSDANPSLEKLMCKVFITNIFNICGDDLPNNFNQYVLPKISESSVFLTNYKNNSVHKDSFQEISKELSLTLNIPSFVKKMKFENIKNNDVFIEFDKAYICKLIEFGNTQVNLDKIDEYLIYRKNTHFYTYFINEYETIKYAFYLLNSINQFERECFSISITEYANKYSQIDKYYDLYVYYYNKVSTTSFSELNQLVENKYNNVYLDKINHYWDNKLLEYGSYENIPGVKQNRFYSNFVYSKLNREKTCVIISDALRYEAGLQLNDYLNSNAKLDSSIQPMVSTVPSYTQLGMAALLPNMSVRIDENYNVLVNGMRTNGIDNRNDVLHDHVPNAMAIQFEELKNISDRNEMRQRLKDVRLLYVYHNQIDARGDHSLTENEVFDAVQSSISEIELVMKRLRDNVNFSRFVITADHGFIYRRKHITESDKIDIVRNDGLYINKRYIYSQNRLSQDGTIEFKTDYLGPNNTFVYVPKGGNIFKTQGAGQNYVHGGASLQEMIVPVIEVKATARRVETTFVDVEPLIANNRITNLLTQMNFVQVDLVSDTVLERVYKVFFVDGNNNVISDENTIYANVTSQDMNARTFTCKFNFINQQYDSRNKYYMVMQTENGIEYKRKEFIMDIAFANDFDFDF